MAEITKLAGTFEAWRLTVGVQPYYLEGALKHCVALGLQPKVRGFQQEVGILFSIVIPRCVCEHPDLNFVPKEMGPFHGSLTHGVKVQLICPPAPETAAT